MIESDVGSKVISLKLSVNICRSVPPMAAAPASPSQPAASRETQAQVQSRDHRDILRFMYQTTAKGQGKSFQDWMQSWRQCKQHSVGVDANSPEGTLAACMIRLAYPRAGKQT